METKVKENGQAKENTVKTDKTQRFVAGNPVNAVSNKSVKEQPKPETVKSQEEVKSIKMETPATVSEQQAQKAEPNKKEIKFQFEQEKPAMNLEQTLKKIKDLSRLSNQREKLIGTIDNLEAFEIKQEDEAEETNLNHFQRCELKITDDGGNTFTTKNPFIINAVAQDIKKLCTDKLTEVEAHISLTL